MKKALRGLLLKMLLVVMILGGGYFALLSSSVNELHIQDAKGAAQCGLFNAAGVLSASQISALKGKENDIVADGAIWMLPVSGTPIYVVDESEDLRLGPGYCYFNKAEAAQAALDNPVSLDDSTEKPKSVAALNDDAQVPAASDETAGAASSVYPSTSTSAFFAQKVTTPGGYLAVCFFLIILSVILTLLSNNVKRGKITFVWDFEFQALKSDVNADEPLRRVSGGQGKVRVSVVLSVRDPSNPNAWLSAMTAVRKNELEIQLRTVLFALLKAELDDKYLDEIMTMLGKSLANKLAMDSSLAALCSEQLVALELVAFNTPEMAEVTRAAWKDILDLKAELARISALQGAGLTSEHIGVYEQGRGFGEIGRGIKTGVAVLGEFFDDKTKSAGS